MSVLGKGWFQTVFLGILLAFLGWVVFQTQHTPWVEMITYPYLLNHGFTPYKDLIAPYTPLWLWFLQGAEGLFGYAPEVSQRLTLVLAGINTVLVFFISKKLWGKAFTALISAAFYVLWFQYFEGNGLWFELAQTPVIILAFYYFYRYFFSPQMKRDLLLGSIFLALAFFMKQSAAWIVPAVVIWGIREIGIRRVRKEALMFILPFALLFAATSAVAYLGGYLTDYWWWAYYYTFVEFPFTPGHNLYPTMPQVLKLAVPLVILLPLVLSVLKKRNEAIFSLIFLASAAMAILPRWSLFHLQPFLALVSIVSIPFGLKWLVKGAVWKGVLTLLVVGIWVTVAARQIGRFQGLEYRFRGEDLYRTAEAVKSLEGDLFIFNGPDQLYVLTGSVPLVKPYVQNFAWQMEVPGMQERVTVSLAEVSPRFVLYSPVSGRGGFEIGDYRPQFLGDYIDGNYNFQEKLTEDVWVLERKPQ